ncbi:tol-pal system protein YbgF [Geomonas sp. RF6]|uniref:tol-pal system protein YbgF n=1 Tax=Geomonas sp. RF6 TaxID=2897342 RepID=UPI001E4781B6|nr:tol-pal system protein YbgF [Geomonas sp. RF6]UFS71816.1 tol-pal system protein YbgF [Geomonas sp. RF6]
MFYGRKFGICLILATLCGCVATRDELSVVQRDLDEMKSRLFTVNKDLAQVHTEVQEGVQKSLVGYTQRVEGLEKDVQGFQKELGAIRKSSADVQASLDSTHVDMQSLSGKVDDVRILAQKPVDDLQLMRDDLSKRLAAIDERLAKLEKSLAEVQKRGEEAQQTPERLYELGVAALKGGDAAKARELLGNFVERYPKHQLTGNAHYWTGESYLSEKNYEQAILEYQEAIKSHGEKTPDAMLKQGGAFKELGDAKSAAYVWRKLVEEFPKSEEAKTAKEKLRQK